VTLKYPPDLVKELRSLWTLSPYSPNNFPALPSDEVQRKRFKPIMSDLNHHWRLSYIGFIESLILRVRKFGHGGAIIFIQQGESPDIGELIAKKLSIKYSALYEGVRDALVNDFLLTLKQCYDAEILKQGKVENSGKLFHENTMREFEIQQNRQLITDAMFVFASASSVDGAVILSDHLDMIGFGAEIITKDDETMKVFEANDFDGAMTKQLDPLDFGTRHRSAFRLCWAMPLACAVVCSQDGGVRCILRDDDRVLCWSNVQLTRL